MKLRFYIVLLTALTLTMIHADYRISGNFGNSGNFQYITNTPAPSGIAFVQSTQTFSASQAVVSATFTTPSKAGSLIFVGLRTAGEVGPSVIDNKGDIYTLQNGFIGDGSSMIAIYYSSNVLAGVNWVQATFASNDTYGINIVEFSGVNNSSPTLYQSAKFTDNRTHLDTSTGAISGLNSIFYCNGGGSASNGGAVTTCSPGVGYTKLTDMNIVSVQFCTEYQIGTTDRPCDENWGGQAGGRASEIAGYAIK